MRDEERGRRQFLLQMGGTALAAWVNAQWPAIASAAQHAHAAKQSGAPYVWHVLTADQAKTVEAIAARIIPTDELPGATEAGVVYFIDRALQTFASETVETYRTGLLAVDETTAKKFAGVRRFVAASAEQQDEVLKEIEGGSQADVQSARRMLRPESDFFTVIRFHTIAGFLADPEAGGNRDFVGWQVIERDAAHSFTSPFGYYDKNYPGWEKAMESAKDSQ